MQSQSEEAALVLELMKRRQLEDERQIAELNAILATEGGRYLIWRLLEQAGVYRTNFDSDALAMAFREGRRSVGLWLIQELHRADPNAFTRVCREGMTRDAAKDGWDND